MAVGSGLAAQVGFAVETTSGTFETPTSFVEFNSEGLRLDKQRIERTGLRAGRRLPHGWATGTQMTQGNFTFNLSAETVGTLLKACFGSVATTASGAAYQHTFTSGDLPSVSVQVGRPDVGGTVRPFDYAGLLVSSFDISATPNEFVTMSLDMMGRSEATNGSLQSATYAQSNFFTFLHGSLEVASSEVCVDSVSITGNNGLVSYHQICGADAGKPKIKEANYRSYGGTFQADFESLTAYNRYVNGTEAALTLEFEVSTASKLTITGNVRFDGDTPNVTGPEILKQSLPFIFISSTSDASAFTATLINSDTTV